MMYKMKNTIKGKNRYGQLRKIYKRNGLLCVDMNGTYTYLAGNNLKLANAIKFRDKYYIRPIIVELSV